jgi:phosphoglycerate kinase
MKIITELKKKDLLGKKVLVRVDFNVPIKNGRIIDDFRIQQSLPTIKYLLKNGAKVILMSHLGSDGSASLTPVARYLKKNLAQSVELLGNLRSDLGEQENDSEFAKQLASRADLYVNDAFSVSHRAHASVVGVPKYLPSYIGLLFAKEFQNLSLALKPKGKMVVILGGLKFQTKIPLIKKFLKTADQIFIGGALANSFMKALGCDIGASIADGDVDYIKPFLKNKKILLPVDVIKNQKNQIVDIGPEALKQIEQMIKGAKLIVWNGPMGWFETGAKKGTLETARIIARAKGKSIVGGGDTLSAIEELKLLKNFTFVSTAGGAMLDFLATGTLPGIKALK